jgi:hypothetical protein
MKEIYDIRDEGEDGNVFVSINAITSELLLRKQKVSTLSATNV